MGEAGPKYLQTVLLQCQAQHGPQDPEVGMPNEQQIQPHDEENHDDVTEPGVGTGQLHHCHVFAVAVGDDVGAAVQQAMEEKGRGNMSPAALARPAAHS